MEWILNIFTSSLQVRLILFCFFENFVAAWVVIMLSAIEKINIILPLVFPCFWCWFFLKIIILRSSQLSCFVSPLHPFPSLPFPSLLPFRLSFLPSLNYPSIHSSIYPSLHLPLRTITTTPVYSFSKLFNQSKGHLRICVDNVELKHDIGKEFGWQLKGSEWYHLYDAKRRRFLQVREPRWQTLFLLYFNHDELYNYPTDWATQFSKVSFQDKTEADYLTQSPFFDITPF